jgi:hypothetical protein
MLAMSFQSHVQRPQRARLLLLTSAIGRESAKALWAAIPTVYQKHATFHTDQYEVYKGVIPAERHIVITKKGRKTNHIE